MSLLVLCFIGQAKADINAVYDNVSHEDGGKSTVTFRYSVSPAYVVMVTGGEHAGRIVFDRQKSIIRLIDDKGRKYFDLDRTTLDELGATMKGAMAQMQKTLEAMSPEQQAMAGKMMQKAMGGGAAKEPPTFVKAAGGKTIAGYGCTRYDMMQDGVKKSELWTSTDGSLAMAPEEVETIRAMQDQLASLLDAAGSMMETLAGSGFQAFRSDDSVKGFPVKTTTFDGDAILTETTLRQVDHDAIDTKLLEVPEGYERQEIHLPPQPGR